MVVNTDGSCIQGKYGGGGAVRDSQGKVISAFAIPFGQGTSNMDEAATLLFGINWCNNKGFRSVTGETNLLLLTNCIRNKWKTPWTILAFIEEIQ
ncbi:hypothetical protein T459_04205 [Capsicum annuum]|uniref:RNase H type-1 domain-containing protein n=1 Tax=Capsicum annuum TaxID=4072 RepID=A0A2G3A4D5_CAPAN|nr:hypothetical protein T459_04205 [Capsicum annuum]